MNSEIPLISSALFLLLVLALLILILKQLRETLLKSDYNLKQSKRVYVITFTGLIVWLIFLAMVAQMDFLKNFSSMPPRLAVVVLPPLLVVLGLTFSRKMLKLLKSVSLKSLIYVQTFRVLMEFILWLLYRQNIIPIQMTFEGYNYDILAGISAFIVAYYYGSGIELFNRKWFLIFWNVAGIALLANIVMIAVLSTPSPFRQFMNEPANTVIAYFPLVWLPGFVVPFALAMHLFSLKKLMSNDFEINVEKH